MAEPGINRILHLFLHPWGEEWSNKLGYRRRGIGQPYPKSKIRSEMTARKAGSQSMLSQASQAVRL